MVPVIRHICNLSLLTGSFLTALKQALAQPRVKNWSLDLEHLKSYRPISKLPYVSNVVERVVAKRFISNDNTFDLLSTHQLAYRQHHSTETAILSVHNDLVRAVDDGKVTILVLLDLSAAFDRPWHSSVCVSDRQQSFVHNDQQTIFFPLLFVCCLLIIPHQEREDKMSQEKQRWIKQLCGINGWHTAMPLMCSQNVTRHIQYKIYNVNIKKFKTPMLMHITMYLSKHRIRKVNFF